jgi:molybdopterin biosynthesis enzyme
VAPPDAVELSEAQSHIIAPLASGEGTLSGGADADPKFPLRQAGDVLRHIDIAALAAAGVSRVMVRAPRVRIIPARGSGDGIIREAIELLTQRLADGGGQVTVAQRTATVPLEDILAAGEADLVLIVGGSGVGKRDHSVEALARAGKVSFHGVAISPGETSAFGFAGVTPVLILPARLDAVIAGWVMLAEPLLANLCGRSLVEPAVKGTLVRKVTSTIGLDEIVPVRREGDSLIPLPAGYIALRTLAESDGLIIVPADREGFPEGAVVPVRLWT